MRIRHIKVTRWRHFENIELQLSDDASLVCVVGANGTGKSHLLELVAACAHKLGLSQGIEIPRGDPFNDPHDFSLRFFLAQGVSDAVDVGLGNQPLYAQWDRTLTIEDRRGAAPEVSRVIAGGLADKNEAAQFATRVVKALRGSQQVHFLSLDADRAYPKKNFNFNEVAQAYEIDWAGIEYTRGRSYKTSSTLYDEWIKYFLAQENQSGTRLIQAMRRAKASGGDPPDFEDHFEPYAAALQVVLPHVRFSGVDSKKRTLLFDTTGLELSFDQLSGGEREIAFLVGQIDRFGLRQGLFLLDEPELHLNADLIRAWVAYLTGTVSTGQIWLATHSLEAVEAAGQQSTFVLERNAEKRKVDSLARLDSRPVLSALSRAVGTPAFSITQLRFVFVEGEEGVGERERFRNLAGLLEDVRFLECGSCNEVVRRVNSVRALAAETQTGIRMGGVVDRDFRSDFDARSFGDANGVFVLPVHEVENFFLCPTTLAILLHQNGQHGKSAEEMIREAADQRAGSWIFQHAMSTANAESLPEMSIMAKERAKSLSWGQIETDRDSVINDVAVLAGYREEAQEKLRRLLAISSDAYSRKRREPPFWQYCEGKQVLNSVARTAGFSDSSSMVRASFALWGRDGAHIPRELLLFRDYLASL